MRIIVVDDSRTMRMIVIRTLRQAGYQGHDIVEAENGAQALEMIQAQQPDVVLSDWNMPEVSGLELLKALRERGNFVRFGFVTSESSPEMKDKATEAGARFLITKPFTPETFRAALEPILGAA